MEFLPRYKSKENQSADKHRFTQILDSRAVGSSAQSPHGVALIIVCWSYGRLQDSTAYKSRRFHTLPGISGSEMRSRKLNHLDND